MPSKIVGIIPARYASTRLPGKLLIPVLGKTILQRTFENARKSSFLDHLLVATDDARIFDHVTEFGGEAIMTSIDCPSGTDRLAEVVKKESKCFDAKAIINIQGDEPCIDPKSIDAVIKVLLEDPYAVMATLASPLHSIEEAKNPAMVKCVLDQKGNALYFSRCLFPNEKTLKKYFRHIGLYAYKPEFVLTYQKLPPTPLQQAEDLEQLKVLEHGYRIKVAIIESYPPDVNTHDDLKIVEQWLCKQNISL